MNVLGLISQLIIIETLRLTVSTRDEAKSLISFKTMFFCKIVFKIGLSCVFPPNNSQDYYSQHSSLDDHLLRICLIKTLLRKNPIVKEKEYSILVNL
jgi:hypothetical protein